MHCDFAAGSGANLLWSMFMRSKTSTISYFSSRSWFLSSTPRASSLHFMLFHWHKYEKQNELSHSIPPRFDEWSKYIHILICSFIATANKYRTRAHTHTHANYMHSSFRITKWRFIAIHNSCSIRSV